MTKQREDLSILLMQIREDKETALEEYYEFIEFGELQKDQITCLNVFDTPTFGPEVLEGHDALFVGGSSDATVLKPDLYPFVKSSRALLRYCYDTNLPVFASCFGFQVVIEELGGKVILDRDNMEMGLAEIELTDAAKDDPFLYDVPKRFWAVSGHQERAVSIPDDAILFGYNEVCPYHLIKFSDKPFYAFQFHPEVGRDDLIARITRYQTRYLTNQDELQKIIESAVHDTPESNVLVKKFIDRVILA